MFRDEKTMYSLFQEIATKHNDILAVVLNGSRANPNANSDKFQDYDILFIVDDVKRFVDNKSWISDFGDILIKQEPDSMDGIWPKHDTKYTFLMRFTDGNRIDLTLVNKSHYQNMHKDSLSKALLDKNNILTDLPAPNESDYIPTKPNDTEFFNCTNEFFWVSIYVAKGLARNEIVYAKTMLDCNVRTMLIKLLTWKAAIDTNWSKNIGNFSKYLDKYLDKSLWQRFEQTYCGSGINQNWDALLSMAKLFHEVVIEVRAQLNLSYDDNESLAVIDYLISVRNNMATSS